MEQHDSSYKQFFSHPQMVKDLMTGFVHQDWVKELDFDTLESVKSSFITDDLRQREDDVIWRVRWSEDWIYVYLLIEFQSNENKFMAVRIMNYVSLLYQDLIRQNQLTHKKRLPPVFPIVLYNGKKRWKAAQNVLDLLEPVSGGLERYSPSMPYLLIDQGAMIEAQGVPAELKNLAAALFRLEHSRTKEDLINILGHLVVWLNTPEQTTIRQAFTAWLTRSMLPARFPELDELPPMGDLYEVQSMLAEQVKEWRKQWQEEGMERGMAEGQLKKARAIANNLLKFSQMDDATIAQITELTLSEVKVLRAELADGESS